MKKKDEEPSLMTCCGCGEPTWSRQWHGMKRGKSVCAGCRDLCGRNMDPATFRAFYGIDGIHYNIIRKVKKDEKVNENKG